MSVREHIAIKEALIIVFSSALLGVSYSFVMKKAFFAPTNIPVQTPAAVVPPAFISYEEALALHKEGVLFVDARHEYDYKLGHIKGAINIPLKDFSLPNSALAAVNKEKTIVTYCDGAECNSSIDLAKTLSDAGFTQVKMFFGGWNEWQQHRGPTETSQSSGQ